VTFTGEVPTSGQFTDAVALSARLTDDANAPIAGETLHFQLLGRDGFRQVNAETGADGMASVTLQLDAPPGAYDLRSAYAGKVGVYDQSMTAPRRFDLFPEDTVMQLRLEGQGAHRRLYATLVEGDNSAAGIEDALVTFYANAERFGEDLTNEHGIAGADVPNGTSHKASFSASFAGNRFFLASGTN
jgi:hypothetical protein